MSCTMISQFYMDWYSMVDYVWYGMVWYGMVWHGMVWYGMVWYGMVWYGMVMMNDDEKQYLFRDVQLSNSWFKWSPGTKLQIQTMTKTYTKLQNGMVWYGY